MPTVLAISGAVSPVSRTAALLELVAGVLRAEPGCQVGTLAVRGLPAEALLHGQRNHPDLVAAVAAVAAADGVVIATPIYQAAYSGALKTLLDLLPQFALAGKAVLPLATGGSRAHVLALDYALRPVLAALAADHVVPGYFVLDQWISDRPGGGIELDPEPRAALDAVVRNFVGALYRREPVPVPGGAALG